MLLVSNLLFTHLLQRYTLEDRLNLDFHFSSFILIWHLIINWLFFNSFLIFFPLYIINITIFFIFYCKWYSDFINHCNIHWYFQECKWIKLYAAIFFANFRACIIFNLAFNNVPFHYLFHELALNYFFTYNQVKEALLSIIQTIIFIFIIINYYYLLILLFTK